MGTVGDSFGVVSRKFQESTYRGATFPKQGANYPQLSPRWIAWPLHRHRLRSARVLDITAADATASPQPAADDALVFTMPETTARRSTRRRPPTPTEYREEDLPF